MRFFLVVEKGETIEVGTYGNHVPTAINIMTERPEVFKYMKYTCYALLGGYMPSFKALYMSLNKINKVVNKKFEDYLLVEIECPVANITSVDTGSGFTNIDMSSFENRTFFRDKLRSKQFIDIEVKLDKIPREYIVQYFTFTTSGMGNYVSNRYVINRELIPAINGTFQFCDNLGALEFTDKLASETSTDYINRHSMSSCPRYFLISDVVDVCDKKTLEAISWLYSRYKHLLSHGTNTTIKQLLDVAQMSATAEIRKDHIF